MALTDRSYSDKEAKAKLVQRRVQSVERHLGQLCETIGSIARKNARLRDKGDLLALNVQSFAESDKLNPTSRLNLLQFAENYSAIQDYCHAKVVRLEKQVLRPLTKYGELCRFVKRNIKSEISACGKEKKAVQKLERLQIKGDKQNQIVQAEQELEKVQGEEQLVGQAMELEVDRFEKDKISDVKTTLTELVKIEMLYHAKALEYLYKCFENVQNISVEDDLNEFRLAMVKMDGESPRRGSMSARSTRDDRRLGADASTLTTANMSTTARSSTMTASSTGRSSDTRASGTYSSSTMSSAGRWRGTNNPFILQPAKTKASPSPRPRSQSAQGRRPSQDQQRVRISSATQEFYF